ncbi:histidine-specific methyltransferase [Melampsora americana]|nr:histidine-specific methyltransferase [Melampsora americana]
MSIVELGAGSLKKTTHLLRNVANLLRPGSEHGHGAFLSQAEYYALDLEYSQLVSTLSAVELQEDSGAGPLVGEEVQTRGICGTYTQGLEWLTDSLSTSSSSNFDSGMPLSRTEESLGGNQDDRRAILWLGSSIGNLSPREALEFLRNELRPALHHQTRVLIGIDNCKIPEKVEKAYNDSEGVTRQFILNGITVLARMLGLEENILRSEQFEYVSRYNVGMSRNEAYLRAREAINITIPALATQVEDPKKDLVIHIESGELILIEKSYKFTDEEVHQLFHSAGLRVIQTWSDQSHLNVASRSTSGPTHTLYLIERAGFSFDDLAFLKVEPFEKEERTNKAIRRMMIDPELSRCETFFRALNSVTMENIRGLKFWDQFQRRSKAMDPKALHPSSLSEQPEFPRLFDAQKHQGNMPSMHEWDELWSAWDLVTMGIIPQNLLHTKPIDLRHICLFYLGHIPVFSDIHLSRYFNEPYSEPKEFSEIFERGIDPDMEDPSICNAHSKVPEHQDEWPSLSEILDFKDSLRARISNVYKSIEDQSVVLKRSLARVLWMIYEHEAMHLETLLYMLVQMPSLNILPTFSPPDWRSLSRQWELESETESTGKEELIEYSEATTLLVGHDDLDRDDENLDFCEDHQFGWDNEHPARSEVVGPFKLSPKPISNLDYLAYVLEDLPHGLGLDEKVVPASWNYTFNSDSKSSQDDIQIRTVYGLVPFSVGKHWPVQASGRQLAAYARRCGGRLPTANELRVYLRDNPPCGPHSPVGFRHWHPIPARSARREADGVSRGGMNGGVWEWTETVFTRHDDFQSSSLYPGYSGDFFDGAHWVLLGGSWATIPKIAQRSSFV